MLLVHGKFGYIFVEGGGLILLDGVSSFFLKLVLQPLDCSGDLSSFNHNLSGKIWCAQHICSFEEDDRIFVFFSYSYRFFPGVLMRNCKKIKTFSTGDLILKVLYS